MRYLKYNVLLIVLLYGIQTYCQEIEVYGVVFVDLNKNGTKEENEKGISKVVVSDQKAITTTDSEGRYTLKTDNEFPQINISMPSGYKGVFFYSKVSEVNFPLHKDKNQDSFKFIHASDTHVDSLNLPRMERFRIMVDSIKPDFVLITGDLIRDALRVNEETAKNYYQMYLNEIAKFNTPVYSGVGNHELFGIERDKSLVSQEHPLYGKKMYRSFLGPNYYSFNYGDIHFISVDAVEYQNLYYFGGIDSIQLNWLEKDIKLISKKKSIITFNHIPFMSPGFSFQDFKTHPFYGPQLLEHKGQKHHRHIVYNFHELQNIIGERSYPLALSGHYHAAQEGKIEGNNTLFAQTSAITRPDQFNYQGFMVKSGFTLYEVKDGTIISSKFMPLNFN